jgi:hypothetical protein
LERLKVSSFSVQKASARLVTNGWQGNGRDVDVQHATGKLSLSLASCRQVLKCLVAARPACWSVPFDRNSRFVGHSTLLAQLDEMLAHTGRFKKAAIVGLGGIGKTQIALELAYRTKDKSPRTSVFWVAALSIDTVRKAYVGTCSASCSSA